MLISFQFLQKERFEKFDCKGNNKAKKKQVTSNEEKLNFEKTYDGRQYPVYFPS